MALPFPLDSLFRRLYNYSAAVSYVSPHPHLLSKRNHIADQKRPDTQQLVENISRPPVAISHRQRNRE